TCPFAQSLPRRTIGTERMPSVASSAKASLSSSTLTETKGTPCSVRNSFILRQLVQPGCQYALMTDASGDDCAMGVLLKCRRRILGARPRGKDVTLRDARICRNKPRRKGPEMTSAPGLEIRLNGVRYRWPDRPVVVVCNDGGDPAYFDRALKDGIVPNVARFMETGFCAIAQCIIPSFTCPNNVSIVTGSPPSIHGISGNFYLEPETGKAVVMTGPELMRSTTILAEFSRNGAKVAAITAKDKLRQQLGKDMNFAGGCINFSSEKADKCNKRENGIENVL